MNLGSRSYQLGHFRERALLQLARLQVTEPGQWILMNLKCPSHLIAARRLKSLCEMIPNLTMAIVPLERSKNPPWTAVRFEVREHIPGLLCGHCRSHTSMNTFKVTSAFTLTGRCTAAPALPLQLTSFIRWECPGVPDY